MWYHTAVKHQNIAPPVYRPLQAGMWWRGHYLSPLAHLTNLARPITTDGGLLHIWHPILLSTSLITLFSQMVIVFFIFLHSITPIYPVTLSIISGTCLKVSNKYSHMSVFYGLLKDSRFATSKQNYEQREFSLFDVYSLNKLEFSFEMNIPGRAFTLSEFTIDLKHKYCKATPRIRLCKFLMPYQGSNIWNEILIKLSFSHKLSLI